MDAAKELDQARIAIEITPQDDGLLKRPLDFWVVWYPLLVPSCHNKTWDMMRMRVVKCGGGDACLSRQGLREGGEAARRATNTEATRAQASGRGGTKGR